MPAHVRTSSHQVHDHLQLLNNGRTAMLQHNVSSRGTKLLSSHRRMDRDRVCLKLKLGSEPGVAAMAASFTLRTRAKTGTALLIVPGRPPPDTVISFCSASSSGSVRSLSAVWRGAASGAASAPAVAKYWLIR